MKPNFILTKSNISVFIKRFNSLLNKTGMVESIAFYTGAKDRNAPLKKADINERLLLEVEKTCISYIDKETIEFDSYPSGMKIGKGKGLIIRINTDSCFVIHFNQKMKWTPNQVTLIGDMDMPFYKHCGSKHVLKISHNVEKGRLQNREENKYAEIYWNDYEEEYLKNYEYESYID